MTNFSLREDLQIKNVIDLAKLHYIRFQAKLNSSTNLLITNMATHYMTDKLPRNLKRNWNRDLLLNLQKSEIQLDNVRRYYQ